MASHVDVLSITQNPPRRLAQVGMPHMRPAADVDKLLHLRGCWERHFIKTIKSHVIHFYIVF